eukprot:950076-Pelagomonas_calceolata.AAC.3
MSLVSNLSCHAIQKLMAIIGMLFMFKGLLAEGLGVWGWRVGEEESEWGFLGGGGCWARGGGEWEKESPHVQPEEYGRQPSRSPLALFLAFT